jgi:predicted Zn-dependent protease
MPKSMDLSNRPDLTDLLVDIALTAVWHGLPLSSKAIIDWMRFRSDDAIAVQWIEAFRCMRIEQYAEAEETLLRLRVEAPKDDCVIALLASLLEETGKPGTAQLLSELDARGDNLDPGARAIVHAMRERQGSSAGNTRLKPQQSRVTMG